MKRTLIVLLCLILFAQPLVAMAEDTPEIRTSREYLADGSYFETTLTVADTRTVYTRTGSKSTTYYTSDNVAIWKLSLTGTFSINYGVSATATDAQANVTIYKSGASMEICDAYTSGSAAFGYAAVRYKNTYTEKEISLNCDKYGNIT